MARYANIPNPVDDSRYFQCKSWERHQIEFCGVWIYREFQERDDNPEYSFYSAAGYWATETLEEMKAQINKSYAHKRAIEDKEADLRREIAQEESKALSSLGLAQTLSAIIGGAVGLSIGGPIGLIAGAIIGGSSITIFK